jgi:hypothetical protein
MLSVLATKDSLPMVATALGRAGLLPFCAATLMIYIVVIAAVFGHALLQTPMFLVLCAALYPATVLVERRANLFRAQPAYYARLRLQLTAVATATLLLAATPLLDYSHVEI